MLGFLPTRRRFGPADPGNRFANGFAPHAAGIVMTVSCDNDADSAPVEPTLFSAIVTPHRSLGTLGFVVVMVAVGLVSFAAGLAFLLMGAWPVFGFFGLDVLLVYLAFRANYRAAAAYEEVDGDALRAQDTQGQSSRHRIGMEAQSGVGEARLRHA